MSRVQSHYTILFAWFAISLRIFTALSTKGVPEYGPEKIASPLISQSGLSNNEVKERVLQLLNETPVETRWGYRLFQLLHGDITQLQIDVDVLVVSAIGDGYFPVPGTVMGALYENRGIDVEDLMNEMSMDLRDVLGCWVSRPTGVSGIGQILCLELFDEDFNMDDSVANVFATLSLLEAKGLEVRNIALPLLGTGLAGLSHEDVMSTMLRHALKFMERSQTLEKTMFVVYDIDTAESLDEAMNEVLGRAKVVLPKEGLLKNLGDDLLNQVRKTYHIAKPKHLESLNELERLMGSDRSRAYEIGMVGRKLIEFIVDDILKPSRKDPFDLYSKIEQLRNPPFKISEWILYYMHVLRVFGNESVHSREREGRCPVSLVVSDISLSLMCILRVLEFWTEYSKRTHES